MADVFISHSTLDRQIVEQKIVSPLQSHGISTWYAVHEIRTGTQWPDMIMTGLKSCRWFLVVMSKNAVASDWVRSEVHWAMEERRDWIVPVLLEDCDWQDLHIMIRRIQYVDFRHDPGKAWSDLLLRLNEKDKRSPAVERPLATSEQVRVPPLCPYPGMAPFDQQNHAAFFGREAQIAAFLSYVRQSSVAPVIGNTGSGKTSFVFAGLLPRLQEESDFLISCVRPGADPFGRLADSLFPWLKKQEGLPAPFPSPIELARYLEHDRRNLRDLVTGIAAANSGRRLLLIMDDLDDLFYSAAGEQTLRFLDAILDLLNRAGRCTWIPVLPSHLLARSDFYEPLGRVLARSRPQVVGEMTPDELESAIQQPAERLHVHFEQGLIQRIRQQAGNEPGSLALIQCFLPILWKRLSTRNGQPGWWVTHDAFDAAGQFPGFLVSYADRVLDDLPSGERQIAHDIFARLIRVGENAQGAADTSLRIPVTALIAQVHLLHGETQSLDVIRQLADKRLVVMSLDAASGQDVVEIAHTVLCRNRGFAGELTESNFEFLRWRTRLSIESSGPASTGAGQRFSEYIIPYEESERMERSAETVWVVTRHFVWNLYHPSFQQIVKANLRAGKKYHYVYPREIQAQADQFKTENGIPDDSSQVKFTPIDRRHFLFVHHQIVIYDPDKPWPQSKGLIADLPNSRSSETFDAAIGKEDLGVYIAEFKYIVAESTRHDTADVPFTAQIQPVSPGAARDS